MNRLSDLMNMPLVEPLDRYATNGGVLNDYPTRTKAELARERAFDAVQLRADEVAEEIAQHFGARLVRICRHKGNQK